MKEQTNNQRQATISTKLSKGESGQKHCCQISFKAQQYGIL